MDYEILGFIKASNHRYRILEMLCSGITSKEDIAHRLRLREPMVNKTLEELLEKELIKAGKEGYTATERGQKAFRSVAR